MNGVQVEKETLALVHEYLDAAFDGCEGEVLTRMLPGATVGPIGAIYLHAVASEDWAVQQLIQRKPKIADTGGWFERLGMAQAKDPDFSKANMDLTVMKEFTQAVRSASFAYLDSISDADLDREIDWFGRATHNIAWVLADVVHAHQGVHAGEIAALKGVMGLKGLPF